MKTQANKAIVFDDQCPMCQWYTGEFVKHGMLSEENRLAFRTLHTQNAIHQIDLERAKSEIPLVDTNGGETIYGIDSLLTLLEGKIPFLVSIAKWKPLYWFFKRLYFLVSFNRRIISGAVKTHYQIDCTPPFNLKYRLVYLGIAAILASLFTATFSWALLRTPNEITAHLQTEQVFLAIAIGWVLQAAFTFFTFSDKKEWLEYSGHLGTLAIIGSAVLLPAISISFMIPQFTLIILSLACFMSFSLMLKQHIKRVKNGEWKQWLTASWMAFLLAALTIVLTFNI